MSENIAKNLQAYMLANRITVRGLARQSGVAPAAISKMLNNVTTPRLQTLNSVARALGLSADDLESADFLTRNAGSARRIGCPVPVLSISQLEQCGRGDPDGIVPENWVPLPPFTDLAEVPLVAMTHTGVAMEPDLEEGDLLYLSNVLYADRENKPNPKAGDFVLAMAEGVPTPIVRTYVRGDTGDGWLLAENIRYPGEQKMRVVAILGVVVAKASRYR